MHASPEAHEVHKAPMSTKTIGQEIDALYDLKQKKKKLEAQAELVQEDIDKVEAALLERMDREQTTKGAGLKASVTVGQLERFSISDDEAFYKYIKRTGYFHLLEKRPSVTGCRELYERNKAIPGITPYIKRTVKVTAITKEK